MLTEAGTAELGLARRFCFSTSIYAKDCRNVGYKTLFGTTTRASAVFYGVKNDSLQYPHLRARLICSLAQVMNREPQEELKSSDVLRLDV